MRLNKENKHFLSLLITTNKMLCELNNPTTVAYRIKSFLPDTGFVQQKVWIKQISPKYNFHNVLFNK